MATFDLQLTVQLVALVAGVLGLFVAVLRIIETYLDIGDKMLKRRTMKVRRARDRGRATESPIQGTQLVRSVRFEKRRFRVRMLSVIVSSEETMLAGDSSISGRSHNAANALTTAQARSEGSNVIQRQ